MFEVGRTGERQKVGRTIRTLLVLFMLKEAIGMEKKGEDEFKSHWVGKTGITD